MNPDLTPATEMLAKVVTGPGSPRPDGGHAPRGTAPRPPGRARRTGRAGLRPQRALAEALAIHPSDMVAIVDDLAARDLAARAPDPADRRRDLVSPTPAGRRLLRRATADSRRVSAGILASLTEEDRATVEDLLGRALLGQA